MSAPATSSQSIETQALQFSSQNNLPALIELFKGVSGSQNIQYFTDMALIGASNANDAAEAAGVSRENLPAKDTGRWAMANGATPLWGIQQPRGWIYDRTKDTNRELRMLGGAGEVAKGTFKGM